MNSAVNFSNQTVACRVVYQIFPTGREFCTGRTSELNDVLVELKWERLRSRTNMDCVSFDVDAQPRLRAIITLTHTGYIIIPANLAIAQLESAFEATRTNQLMLQGGMEGHSGSQRSTHRGHKDDNVKRPH